MSVVPSRGKLLAIVIVVVEFVKISASTGFIKLRLKLSSNSGMLSSAIVTLKHEVSPAVCGGLNL